ncbi:MAG: MBL fold metallo-hydrolase [Clostridiales bacterium]|nr:MBL fold metallo-hydrolase [Clostridiales bacterium]
MSIRSDYEKKQAERERFYSSYGAIYATHQEKRYVHPFQIYGNVYYVGDSWVCVHLIDTGDGLLLIDSGNVGAKHLLIHSIWEMGFRPDDVKWIISSHGHLDHVGAATFFRDMFSTRLYLAEPDARMFAEHPEFSFLQDSPDVMDDVFTPDEVIRDGDILTFGNTTIQCVLVPGHTEGCVAMFFDACENGRTLRCGYYGGFGFNTLTCAHLDEMGDTEHRMWKIYEESILKVADRPVDIFLGNHCENNKTLEKREIQKVHPSPNPFIDSKEWNTYLMSKIDDLHAFVQEEKQRQL